MDCHLFPNAMSGTPLDDGLKHIPTGKRKAMSLLGLCREADFEDQWRQLKQLVATIDAHLKEDDRPIVRRRFLFEPWHPGSDRCPADTEW